MTESGGRRGNIIAAVLLLVLAITFLSQTLAIGPPGRASDPGADGYPQLINIALVVLAVLVARQRGSGEAMPDRKAALYVIGAVALLIAYTLMLEQLGYILATALFLLGAMLLMNARSVAALIVVSVGVSTSLFLLFYTAFGVSLPRGTLERLIS